MDVGIRSDPGGAQRANNDAALCEPLAGNATLLAVADAFGSFGKDVAIGQFALITIRDYLRRKLRPATPPKSVTVSEMRGLLQSAFAHANARLYTQSGSHDDYVSSGTTVTCALIVGHQAFIGHVGDSRAYLMRGERLQLLTSDDALVADTVPSAKTTRKAQARARSLLTRTLGTQSSLDATVIHFELLAGDQVLLCTDGVHRYVEDDDLSGALGRDAVPARIAEALVLTAKARGSSDNATVVFGRDLTVHAGADPVADPPLQRGRSKRLLLVFVVLWSAVVLAGMIHALAGVR